jgi:hypothetical protein
MRSAHLSEELGLLIIKNLFAITKRFLDSASDNQDAMVVEADESESEEAKQTTSDHALWLIKKLTYMSRMDQMSNRSATLVLFSEY